MTGPVWYIAYGSNLCESRFLAYINGSDGSLWPKTRGCRDKTPPIRNISGTVPGKIYFAKNSKNWDNGGVAFYESTVKDSTTFVRMYLVTSGQFNDIFLQENGLAAGDITKLINDLSANSSAIFGSGWYRKIWRTSDFDGQAAYTFTTSTPRSEIKSIQPSKKYLDTIARGLRESHGLSSERIVEYLEIVI